MVSERHVRFEVDEGVAVITLNRPEHMNTFTGQMGEELGEAYRRCDEDDAVRAVILTGAGIVGCGIYDMQTPAEFGQAIAIARGTPSKPLVEPEDLFDDFQLTISDLH